MSEPLSRRLFLALTGGALAAPKLSWAANEVPTLLDHILLGSSDLDHGIAFVEERVGVRAVFGGIHPGGGTQNALLSLGTGRYLEIIAPDPQQHEGSPLWHYLPQLKEPKLVGWAAHPGDLQAFAERLAERSILTEGPTAGSRKRPDGRVLEWKTLTLKDNPAYLLPFFIDWSADSLHPSADAPKGCSLVRFEAAAPDPEALAKKTALLGLDLPIASTDKPQLRATFAGPKGQFSVTS